MENFFFQMADLKRSNVFFLEKKKTAECFKSENETSKGASNVFNQF